MNLAVGYNAFDGLEILQHSINSIRNNVDFIIIAYQKISNFGNKNTENIEEVLNDLKNKKKIDEIIFYETNLKVSPHDNELNKRNLCLDLARNKKFDYFLNMDCDELYLGNQFQNAKRMIEQNNYEATCCKTKTYYKFTNIIISPDEDHFVPFIHKISEKKYIGGTKWKFLCDPTRKIPCDYPFAFDNNTLLMHHLSHVRKDLSIKLNNNSAKCNYSTKINELLNYYNNFIPGEKVMITNSKKIYNTKLVDDILTLI